METLTLWSHNSIKYLNNKKHVDRPFIYITILLNKVFIFIFELYKKEFGHFSPQNSYPKLY